MKNPNFKKREYNNNSDDVKPQGILKRKHSNKFDHANKKARTNKPFNGQFSVEEINSLKETEDLYHSNLFRMQIDETLKEVRIKSKQKLFIDQWIECLKSALKDIPENELTSLLSDPNYILKFKPIDSEKKFNVKYVHPESCKIYGAHVTELETSIGLKSIVDIALTLPDGFLKRDDYLNQIYLHKRALYLFHILKNIQDNEKLGENIRIVFKNNDTMKPVIELTAEEITFQINVIPNEGAFKVNRFIPQTNNIKFKNISDTVFATPSYNYSILFDMTIEKNQSFIVNELKNHTNLKSAVKLLKIWMKQRQFDEGFYGFNGFLVSMYLIHLLKSQKIYPTMSCYQIIRLFWNQFGNTNLNVKGISLAQQQDQPNQPTMEEFHQYYDLVFVDSTGFCNLLSYTSIDLYLRIKEESLNAIKLLDNKSINSFQHLFLTNVPICLQYDHVFSIKYEQKWYQSLVEKYGTSDDKVDYFNNCYPHLRKIISTILKRGLGNRVSAILPITPSEKNELHFGLILNPENAFEIVDKGPQANEPEAAEFRKLWGNKAEIRRFKDGSITESVLWCTADTPIGEKRLICKSIVMFLLKHHFNINAEKVNYVAQQFDVVIRQIFNEKIETNEERSLVCIKTFDEVGKELRNLNDLPLEITSVLGIDAVFRYCDATPTAATASLNKSGVINKTIRGNYRAQKVMNGIIQLAPSGKWPDELEAMKRIKAAFYIEIAKQMDSQFPSTKVYAFTDCVEILKNKMLYRLKIVHPKEVALAKQEISAANNLTKLYKTNAASLMLEFEGSVMPKMTSALHGLHHQHSSFGPTVAIAKRWMASQMIDSYLFPDECIELLIAEMFVKKIPMPPSSQPQVGFFRFLHRLAHLNYENEMIMVNFNDELSLETIEELENHFNKCRKDFPTLFIATSCDFQNRGIWSSRAPSVNIMQRIKFLAQNSLDILNENFVTLSMTSVKTLFTPSYEGYNLIINLNDKYVRKYDVVLQNIVAFKSVKYEEKNAPPADVDFVRCYLKELRVRKIQINH